MKQEKKIEIKVLIEGDQTFIDEFNANQKIQVIINKVLAKFNIDADGRELRHEDGKPITDYNQTIEDSLIENHECLRFIKKAPNTPDRDKGFA